MSNNYPYRRPPADTDHRPDPGPYGSSDNRRPSPNHNLYRAPQESVPSHLSSSPSSSIGALWSQDGALSILTSCGLEPSDLALLAELPEEVLTIDTLPHVLNQIKEKKGTVKPLPPSAPSSSSPHSSSSAHRPDVNPSISDRDHHSSQLVQYPIGHTTPSSLPHNTQFSDQDRWGNPRTSSSVRADPPSSSSSSSSYMVDFHLKPGPSDYGKTGRDAGSASSQDYHQRLVPSEYGKTSRDGGPASSQDYHQRPVPSDYGKTGRDGGPASSQDYHQRPIPSDYGKMGRDGGPASSQDYHQRLVFSEYGKTSKDGGLASSQDYHQRPVPSEYGKTGRDCGPASSQDYHQRLVSSEYGKVGRDGGLFSSLDYHRRPGPSEYGKTGRDPGPVSSQDRTSFSSAGGGQRTCPSSFSQPGPAAQRSAPPPNKHHPTTRWGHREPETSSIRSNSSSQPAALIPSKKEVLDFHGTSPSVFPYSCSLCDITVMSERVWIKHINGSQHADGQLSLLQQFPNWDCRMGTVSRADNQSEKRKDEGQADQRQCRTANQDSKPQQNQKPQKKTSDKGKVVCVKFPAQSVDEAYLRTLSEPFGKIIKILMFPSLAFVELGSNDQAKDLVKFHMNHPPTVNGEQMEFTISKTFSFLQSSRVVSFSPAPSGENSRSDLISIVKRFSAPLYTLFLPSTAFVEMKNTPDAQKLVDYYSSNTLRINNEVLKVTFSGEYRSLMRVASAKRYEDDTSKSTRSLSRENEDKTTESKNCRNSKDPEEGNKSSRGRKTRTRSRSRDKTSRRKRSRSKDEFGRDKRPSTRSKSREKSSGEKRSRSWSRSRGKRSRSRSGGKSSGEKRSRSRSRSRGKRSRSRSEGKSSGEKRSRSRSRSRGKRSRSSSGGRSSGEKRSRSKSRSRGKRSRSRSGGGSSGEKRSRSGGELVIPEKTGLTDTESRTDPDPVNNKDTLEAEDPAEEEAESSAEDSDIEGMEVIGEDGEDLEETLDDDEDEEEEEEEEEEAAEKEKCPAERTDSHGAAVSGKEEGPVKEKEGPVVEKEGPVKEKEEPVMEEEQQEPDFPFDLENCITLDELTDESDQDEVGLEPSSPSSRVLYLKDLPRRLNKASDFINLVRDFGTPVSYIRLCQGRKGLVEMSTPAEALKAVEGLNRKPAAPNGFKVNAQISNKHRGLDSGKKFIVDKDSEEWRRESQTSRRSEGRKESTKESPEDASVSEESPEDASVSEESPEDTSVSKESPEDTSVSKESPEDASVSKEGPEDASVSEESPEDASVSEESPEDHYRNMEDLEESAATKTPEKKTLKRKGSPENDSVPQRKRNESGSDETRTQQELQPDEAPGEQRMEIPENAQSEETSGPGLKVSESPRDPDSTGDSPKPQTEQEPAAADPDSELHVDQTCEPAGGAAEPQKPSRPVGTEFIRPVVGYFCNLCQLIYADEDEAKLQHCSSASHYRKYQEKTGKDPWTS